MTPARALPLAALAAVTLGVAACASESGTRIAVTGTDDSCAPATSQLTAGKVTFDFTNKAGKVSELYVLREDDSVVGEVENVTTNTKRALTVDLSAGEYSLVCKPGQAGDGFRSEIVVTGAGGATTLVANRTVKVTASTYAFTLPAGLTVKQGEVIRFELENTATDFQHEMEVFDPSGEAVGEVGPTDPGKTGAVTIAFTEAGTYRLVCGIDDHEAAGMVATIEVSPA